MHGNSLFRAPATVQPLLLLVSFLGIFATMSTSHCGSGACSTTLSPIAHPVAMCNRGHNFVKLLHLEAMRVLSLRGGRREDHLPRAFKRALRRHTKARLQAQRGRRLRKQFQNSNRTRATQPPVLTLKGVARREEEPEPRWAKALEQDPPDFTLFLEDWSRGHRPEDCPIGPDGKRKGPHWDHSLPCMRDMPATQERLWEACGCYSIGVASHPETVGLHPDDGWGGARDDGSYSPFDLDRCSIPENPHTSPAPSAVLRPHLSRPEPAQQRTAGMPDI